MPYHASQEARTLVARVVRNISRASEIIHSSPEICTLWRLCLFCVRQAYQQDPDYYGRYLASVLSKYGQSLHDLDAKGSHFEGAISSAAEAVDIRRRLYTRNPDAEAYKFAQELQLYADLLCANGLPGERAIRSEWVAVLRTLYITYPDRYAIEICRSLLSYARGLSDTGDEVAALDVYSEAASILRNSYLESPGTYLPCLVASLHEYKESLVRAWRLDDAIIVSAELISLLNMLYHFDSAIYDLDYGIGLVDHARLLFENRALSEALPASADAIAFCAYRRRPWLGEPTAEEARLAKLLYYLARQAAAARHYAAASEIVREALELCAAQGYKYALRAYDLSARLSHVLACAGPARMNRRARKLGLSSA